MLYTETIIPNGPQGNGSDKIRILSTFQLVRFPIFYFTAKNFKSS